MVRFHWHVEGQQSAWVPSGGMKVDEATGVRHITLDMELAGQNETVMSLLTVPPDYLEAAKVKPVGIVLGHGSNADDWRGPLLERLVTHLAQQGHLVMRYFCPLKEQRRHRIFEKAMDVAATSPYARAVRKWVLVGYDNGARIAAGVGSKTTTRAVASGFVFLSYPLLDPAPPPPKQKAGATPPTDSVGPLAKLAELAPPMLFVCGEFDRLCPGSKLKEAVEEVLPDVDARVVVLEGLSGRFCEPGTKELAAETLTNILTQVDTFLAAIQDDSLAACPLPRMADLEPSSRPLPDVPESPKREASPEEEEPEPEPPARAAPARAAAGGTAAPPAVAAAVRPAGVGVGVRPAGMIPVMGPNGQPMLIPAAAMAGNPAAHQQLLLLQQQMLAAHMQKQQQAAAGGGAAAAAAANPASAAAAHQQMQLQMAMIAQQMAAAAAARPTAPAAAAAAAPAAVQPQPQAQVQLPAPMAIDPQLPPQ